jgi:hypothetical protein
MLTEILAILAIILNGVVVSSGVYIVFVYFKVKNKYLKMDAKELLGEIGEVPLNKDDETKRERLSAIVAGGGSKQYLGKDLQISDIDTMSIEQINKLYCRYEARLGASMTKTLGNTFINLYVLAASKYLNITDPPKLIQDLEEDPFINHALTSVCCELYYKYGMYLAPFTALLTTTKHINFNNEKTENIAIKKDE